MSRRMDAYALGERLMQSSREKNRTRFPILKTLSENDGQCNAGICLVEDAYRPGKKCIKKRFHEQDIISGLAWREISALEQLDHPNINKLVSYYVDTQDMVGAVFVDFCDKGTLADLIKRHKRARRPIPEGFLWHVFISLVDALRYMQNGPLDMSNPRLWNKILHRDISPSNCFLATGDQAGGYPRPVLGDFGCCVSHIDVAVNLASGRRVERQNPEFEPPEAPGYHLKSDIYQVGLVIVCMSRLEANRWPIPSCVDVERVLGSEYSQELNGLVRKCLQKRINARIEVRELWDILNTRRSKATGNESDLLLP